MLLKDILMSRISGAIKDIGYEVVDIDIVKGKNLSAITVYIYKNGGIGIDDCVKVSELINPILDTINELKFKYNLEVSSPGLDRPLKTMNDFRRNIGETLDITLKDKQKIRTVLKSVDEADEIIDTLIGDIKLSDILNAYIYIDFSKM